MKAHHRRTSLQPADRRLNTAKAHLKSDWLKVSVRPSELHAESAANMASSAASMRVTGHAERPPLFELLETPGTGLRSAPRTDPGAGGESCLRTGRVVGHPGRPHCRLLVTPAVHDSGTDGDRLLTAEEVAHLLGVPSRRWRGA